MSHPPPEAERWDMIENHVMQMFGTREHEMRARLGERQVDLTPPIRRYNQGLLSRIAGWIRSLGRPATRDHPPAAPLHP